MMDHLRKQRNAALRLVLIGAATVASISCGDDQSAGPVDGSIMIGARTSGDDLDANGYLVSVDNGQGQQIGLLDTIYVTALEPGDYVVRLGGIAENCTLPPEANPQTADVVPGDTVEVLFDVTCEVAEPPDDGGGGPLP